MRPLAPQQPRARRTLAHGDAAARRPGGRDLGGAAGSELGGAAADAWTETVPSNFKQARPPRPHLRDTEMEGQTHNPALNS
jgi:hypothetical protein